MKTSFGFRLLLLIFLTTGFAAFGDPAFTDDFESASLNPFWAVVQNNGTVLLSSSAKHSGQQAVQMTQTTSGQLTLQLTHHFSTPQFGTASVWFYYDPGIHYYSSLTVGNSSSGVTAGLGVQDWDGGNFYYSAFNLNHSTVSRSAGWHLVAINTTPTNQAISLDGNAIYSGANNSGFDTVTISTSGPGGTGSYYYDDFSFTPASEPASLEVQSFGNGQLTWIHNAAYSNGLFSIEWASNPDGPWKDSWGCLGGMICTDLTNTVEVPMFYRVKCITNQLMVLPVNFQVLYSITNAVGIISTQRITTLGRVHPTLNANEFTLLEQVTLPTNDMQIVLMRSTDNSTYRYSPDSGVETLEHQLGPVGTSWTNYNYEGAFTRKVTIDAIENVTVPAGTFLCYKFHKQALEIPGSDWYEWVCPGIGIVKQADYWVDPEQNPPVISELQSFGPRP